MCSAGHEGAGSPDPTGCTQCTAGQFKAAAGDGDCTDCLPGTFSAADGATSCDECPADQYVDTAGQTFCDSCAIPSETTDTATGQTACGKQI